MAALFKASRRLRRHTVDDIVRWLGLSSMSWEEAVRWLRERPGQEATVRANYFDLPVTAAAERFSASEEFGEIARLLGRGGDRAILDYGAGNGIASFALARAGWRVTALEPDPSLQVGAGAIRGLARSASLPIEVVERSTLPLPFPDNTFDAVFGRQVLHHVPDLDATVAELARVVKPACPVLITREHVADNWWQKARFLRSHGLNRLYHGENAYPLERYLLAFELARLRLAVVWGPLESVLNYFPGTEEERLAAINKETRRTGRSLREITLADRTPGRIFSFLSQR